MKHGTVRVIALLVRLTQTHAIRRYLFLLPLFALVFASPASAACLGQATTVNNESELNEAIGCFNTQSPPGSHTISLGQDIFTASSTPLNEILATDENVELLIDSGGGSQRKITGFGSSATSNVPLLKITAAGKVTVRNIKLQAAPGPAVLVTGFSPEVVLHEVSLFDSGTGLLVQSGTVLFKSSDSKGNKKHGIRVEELATTARRSKLEMVDSEVAFNGEDGVSFGGQGYSDAVPNQISGSIIRNHLSGNGIVAEGVSVSIVKSVVRANALQGIQGTDSDISIGNSVVEDNTGIGIDISGELVIGSEIYNSGVHYNQVGFQGSGGTYRIFRSTIYENDSTGISLGDGFLELYASTVSGNMGDGIATGSATASISTSTITYNGGDGIVGSTDVTVASSLVVYNDQSGQFYQDCADLFPSFVQNDGNNFDSDGTCGGFGLMPSGLLEPISDNGCTNRNLDFSCVLTHSLVNNSNPAIDSHNCGNLNNDQREIVRGALCDSGSFEFADALCNGKAVTVYLSLGQTATSGNDVIKGTESADVINAFGGDDVICALGGADTINAGRGMDYVEAGFGDDVVTGGRDDDIIFGGPGYDYLSGGPDDDNLYGNDGDDTLFGNSGNDYIDGDDGVDEIRGGSGDDYILTGSGATVGSGVIVDAGSGNDTIYGGPDADEIRGSTDTDIIYGGDGDDRLFGGGGADKIYGDDGSDFIRGNAANDELLGGKGMDNIDGGTGKDMVSGELGFDFLKGSTGNDQVFGGPGADEILGGGGNDNLLGEEGNDTILGGGSDDTMDGGDDIDSCDGEGGVDTAANCESSANVP